MDCCNSSNIFSRDNSADKGNQDGIDKNMLNSTSANQLSNSDIFLSLSKWGASIDNFVPRFNFAAVKVTLTKCNRTFPGVASWILLNGLIAFRNFGWVRTLDFYHILCKTTFDLKMPWKRFDEF